MVNTETIKVAFSKQGQLYRNLYCAECNYIDRSDILFLKADAYCKKNVKFFHMQKHATREAFLEYVSQNCEMKYRLPGSTSLSAVTSNICFESKKVIDYCSYGSPKEQEMQCNGYSAPVIALLSNNKEGVYKNIHCAQCQGYSVIRYSCPGVRSHRTPSSMAILADFTSSSDVLEDECQVGYVFDRVTKTCREIFCPPMFKKVNNVCSPTSTVNPKTQMLPDGPLLYQVIITVSSDISGMNTSLHDNLKAQIMRGIYDKKQHFNKSIPMKVKENCFSDMIKYRLPYDTNMHAQQTDEACLVIDIDSSIIQNHMLSFAGVLEKAFGSLQAIVNATALIFVNHDIFTAYSCPKGVAKRYHGEDIQIVNETVRIDEMIFDMSNILMGIGMTDLEKNRTIISPFWVTVCKLDLHDCPMVSFFFEEYVKTNNSVLLKDSGLLLNETDFFINNGTILICLKKLNFLLVEQYMFFTSSEIQGWMTMIGSSLSIFCLFITLIVYSLLSSLRTLPGKCIIGLSFSLLCAQLLLQLNIHFTAIRLLCKALAISLHFFWLASFTWMSILAFDISQTFADNAQLKSEVQKSLLFKKYAILSIILPTLFVTACVIIDILTDLPFQYGGTKACWIGGNTALLYSFGIPVAVAIFLNISFFLRALCGIIKATKIAKQATKDKSNNNQLLLYTKIASLMGFTWVFGFLAALTKVQELWYIFIAFNSLQGVFISISFTFTRRVLRLIKQKLGPQTNDSQNGNTGVTSLSRSSQNEKH